MQDKIDLLKNTRLFSSLREKEADVLVRYSDIIFYNDGDTIFGEGSPGDSLFIVKEGEVRIVKADGDERVDIAKFIKGELFGELDLFENVPRSAGALAEQDVVLLKFPKHGERFTDIIDKHPDIFAHILRDLIAIIAHRIRETNKLVSEKTKWIDELRSQLLFDKLTGMFNRAYLKEEFYTRLGRDIEKAGILFIKPDNFKYVNDTFGHAAGDGALVCMADTLKRSLKENEIGVRYRGDEIMAILPDTALDKARERAEEIRNAINNIDIRDLTGGEDFHFTTSIGISLFPENTKDPVKLIDIAFNNMMTVRNSGGNRILG